MGSFLSSPCQPMKPIPQNQEKTVSAPSKDTSLSPQQQKGPAQEKAVSKANDKGKQAGLSKEAQDVEIQQNSLSLVHEENMFAAEAQILENNQEAEKDELDAKKIKTYFDRNTHFPGQSTEPPLSMGKLLTPRFKHFFGNLRFITDDDTIKALVDSERDQYHYHKCPLENVRIEDLFEKLSEIRITGVQRTELTLSSGTPHHFNELISETHIIFIDFWANSTLSVSIWKKSELDCFAEGFKRCGRCMALMKLEKDSNDLKCQACKTIYDLKGKPHYNALDSLRIVDDNLRYWVRKALSHWSNYSILLFNCHNQTKTLAVPSKDNTQGLSLTAKKYFVNLPKNLIKGMAMIFDEYCGQDQDKFQVLEVEDQNLKLKADEIKKS